MKGLTFLFVFTSITAWPQNATPEPPPPNLEERFRYYLHRTYTSRERLAFLVADSGLSYLQNDPPEWGRGPETFGARVGSNFGRRVVANTVEFGLGAALGEDTRFRPLGTGSLRRRMWHASSAAFTARLAGGRTRFGYSRLAAIASGVWMTSAWHPRARSVPERWQDVGFAALGKVPDNLLQEFSPDLRRTGRQVLRAVRRTPALGRVTRVASRRSSTPGDLRSNVVR